MKKLEFVIVISILLLILGICIMGFVKGIKEENIKKENIIIAKSECLTYCLNEDWMYSRLMGINEENKIICECYDSNVFALSMDGEKK